MSKGLWQRYQQLLYVNEALGMSVDVSRVRVPDDFFDVMAEPMQGVFAAMDELEGGAIANPDEGRQVGHYWLRASDLAPDAGIRGEIDQARASIQAFAAEVHAGKRAPEKAARFTNLINVGIGGSALGPQFVADALGGLQGPDKLRPHFIDNTDPEGIDRVLGRLAGELDQTIVVGTSKSGGTPETAGGIVECAAAYQRAGLDFAKHAVAVTQVGSKLDKRAESEGWLARFPMWDWVGGRTSVMSAVGLVPATLQGIDVDAFLAGAAQMDVATRVADVRQNPAALLCLSWFGVGEGRGTRDMVVLPYKDRLVLFSRYLQQLVMESLGKRLDRQGRLVRQGITVYGNKGSTDQHAYVQQLREGPDSHFVTFVEVLSDREGESIEVQPGATGGDFLLGFLQGTRRALYESGRSTITVTLPRADERRVGALIALYERAVGYYGELVGINAYHQPGVEAGKKAAASVLELQREVVAKLGPELRTADAIAEAIGKSEEAETVFAILRHLAANPSRGVTMEAGATLTAARFGRNG